MARRVAAWAALHRLDELADEEQGNPALLDVARQAVVAARNRSEIGDNARLRSTTILIWRMSGRSCRVTHAPRCDQLLNEGNSYARLDYLGCGLPMVPDR